MCLIYPTHFADFQYQSGANHIFVTNNMTYESLTTSGYLSIVSSKLNDILLTKFMPTYGQLVVDSYTARLLWPTMWSLLHSYCTGTYTEVTVLLL